MVQTAHVSYITQPAKVGVRCARHEPQQQRPEACVRADAGTGGKQTYSREFKQTPCQQGNAKGSGVGHLEVACRAALQIAPSDVPVQRTQLIGHGV